MLTQRICSRNSTWHCVGNVLAGAQAACHSRVSTIQPSQKATVTSEPCRVLIATFPFLPGAQCMLLGCEGTGYIWVDPETPTCSQVSFLGRILKVWCHSWEHPICGKPQGTHNPSYISFPLGESKAGEEIHGAIWRGHKGLQAVKNLVETMALEINAFWKKC